MYPEENIAKKNIVNNTKTTVLLSKEMRESKFNDALTEKRRQMLRANNHELRLLQRHLQCAVFSKQLKEQQQNIAKLKEEEIKEKLVENEKFTVECDKIRRSILQQEEFKKREKEKLLEVLKCQIGETQKKRRKEFEDLKKDGAEMEKLIKQLQSEDNAKRKESELLCEMHKKEMEKSYRDIELKKQLERKRNIDDAVRNLLYRKTCENIKAQQEAERKRILKEKEDLSERLGQQLATINLEKEKRKDLFISLLVEERKAKDEEEFREALVKQIAERKRFRVEVENNCRAIKTKKEKEFKQEEEKLREEHLRFLEQQDKVWQFSEEKRRRKKIEHNKALREIIELRRLQRASDIAAQIAEFEKTLNDAKISDQEIQQERIFILRTIPMELLSYLPPGVFKPSDKVFLTIHEQKTMQE